MRKSLLLLIFVLLASGVAYYAISNNNLRQKPSHRLKLLDQNCNPGQSACVAADDDHSLTLFFPEQVHYLQPFKMQLTTQGISSSQIEAVNVEYTMVGMDMGLNRFSLIAVNDAKGQQRYEGEGILPVCVSGRVDWLANARVITAEKVYEAVFAFEVTKQ